MSSTHFLITPFLLLQSLLYGQIGDCERQIPICEKVGFIKTASDIFECKVEEVFIRFSNLNESNYRFPDFTINDTLKNGRVKIRYMNLRKYSQYWGIQIAQITYRLFDGANGFFAFPLSKVGNICLYGPVECSGSYRNDNDEVENSYTATFGPNSEAFQISKGLNEKPVSLEFSSLAKMVADDEEIANSVKAYEKEWRKNRQRIISSEKYSELYSFYIAIIDKYNKRKSELEQE